MFAVANFLGRASIIFESSATLCVNLRQVLSSQETSRSAFQSGPRVEFLLVHSSRSLFDATQHRQISTHRELEYLDLPLFILG